MAMFETDCMRAANRSVESGALAGQTKGECGCSCVIDAAIASAWPLHSRYILSAIRR